MDALAAITPFETTFLLTRALSWTISARIRTTSRSHRRSVRETESRDTLSCLPEQHLWHPSELQASPRGTTRRPVSLRKPTQALRKPLRKGFWRVIALAKEMGLGLRTGLWHRTPLTGPNNCSRPANYKQTTITRLHLTRSNNYSRPAKYAKISITGLHWQGRVIAPDLQNSSK